MPYTVWTNGNYTISTDRNHLDLQTIYNYLHFESYWAKGIPMDVLEKSVAGSALCFGIYKGNPSESPTKQIGFARVISDLATFAWLADVFVLPEYRGQGLSKWLVGVIVQHPELQGLRRFMLATNDAHGLYEKYGFVPMDQPERFMQIAPGTSVYQV
ncbi:GNAT family N-acetyltransferase [Effusibacillus lacus]|uniref:N-acetyltransferase n=1 Tax=Effusibacillus lacus TaxID=1348429 RepID=A0A292YHB7_9BACL|nr:GNAT family N-acetyltransferase [Effusibacillus lacus]TCS72329.1 acetyltransferase (GNAT) family protein [Effusibacillus lacus]GAX90207.1 N-acetyltransferase [Effusibacillus lacus]